MSVIRLEDLGDLERMEAHQIQSPCRRVGPQILPKIEGFFKAEHEGKRVFRGAVDSYE